MSMCDCCGYSGQNLPQYRELLKQVAAPRIADLEAENAELLKDQKRIEFMAKNEGSFTEYTDGFSLFYLDEDCITETAVYENWRDAIDAAMGVNDGF